MTKTSGQWQQAPMLATLMHFDFKIRNWRLCKNPQHTHARHNTFMAERICSKGLHTHMQRGACLPPRWVWHLFYAYFSLRSHKGLTPPLPLLPSWGNTWAIKVKYAKMKIYNFLWAFAATPGPCCHIMLPFLCCACLDSRVLFALLSCLALYFGTNLVPLPLVHSPCDTVCDLLRLSRIGEICAIFTIRDLHELYTSFL